MDMLVFVGVQPQLMSSMPWAPDGNNIYVINTTEDYWHEKQKDGRHWQFSPTSHKGLNGTRKFGSCKGSFICKNDDCPKYTTENVCNEIEFVKEKNGPYVCNSCGFFVQHKRCNALKVTEFDRIEMS